MVTVGEMINYLMDHDFKDDQEICFLVGDPQKRLVWHPEKLMGITDQHRPIILLEVGWTRRKSNEVVDSISGGSRHPSDGL